MLMLSFGKLGGMSNIHILNSGVITDYFVEMSFTIIYRNFRHISYIILYSLMSLSSIIKPSGFCLYVSLFPFLS